MSVNVQDNASALLSLIEHNNSFVVCQHSLAWLAVGMQCEEKF